MKIIVLQGKAETGKTTVITKLYHKLCALYEKKSYYAENAFGDFTAIFEINGRIVGITSIGDSADDLKKPFEAFEIDGCEIYVVCCRKKHGADGSKAFVEKCAESRKADIVWYTKAYTEHWNAKYNAMRGKKRIKLTIYKQICCCKKF